MSMNTRTGSIIQVPYLLGSVAEALSDGRDDQGQRETEQAEGQRNRRHRLPVHELHEPSSKHGFRSSSSYSDKTLEKAFRCAGTAHTSSSSPCVLVGVILTQTVGGVITAC